MLTRVRREGQYAGPMIAVTARLDDRREPALAFPEGTLLVGRRLLETVRRYWTTVILLLFGLAMFALVPTDADSAAAVVGGIVPSLG